MTTGLNPVETGMFGWDMFYKELNKPVSVFHNYEKSDLECKPFDEAIVYKKKYMKTKTIVEEKCG